MRKGVIGGTIVCELDKEYFAPWDELTPEQQAVFKDRSAQCDGIGYFSFFCIGCAFLHDSELEESYEVIGELEGEPSETGAS